MAVCAALSPGRPTPDSVRHHPGRHRDPGLPPVLRVFQHRSEHHEKDEYKDRHKDDIKHAHTISKNMATLLKNGFSQVKPL
jgi:hypothetical protein